MGPSTDGSEELIGRLKQFLSSLPQFRIETAILFGSRATGEYLKHSDVDIIVVSQDFRGVPFLDRMKILLKAWQPPPPLEVLCYTPEEFEQKATEIGIVSEAMKTGITII